MAEAAPPLAEGRTARSAAARGGDSGRRPARSLEVAIVGLGPWGLCALERFITCARTQGFPGRLTIHVAEPRTPGVGVYEMDQPDYLLLNNPAGQLALHVGDDGERHPYAVGLYDWAVASGYRWVGDRCVAGGRGRPLAATDFLPRRLMGEYLRWFYEQLVRAAPDGVRVVHHAAAVVGLTATAGRELVSLDSGVKFAVDHVILTPGHTPNRRRVEEPVVPQLAPYPVSRYAQGMARAGTVAVSGMGLVGIDAVMALSVGRGGRFEGDLSRLRYRPSGREPRIRMFSRSGLPFTAKSLSGVDRSDVYDPAICTQAEIGRLRERALAGAGVDARVTLLPLLFAEMAVRYYAQRAYAQGSLSDARAVRESLARAWRTERFQEELDALGVRFGLFDAPAMFFGPAPGFADRGDYEQAVVGMLRRDLADACMPDRESPEKCASEVWRIFRDPIRAVVEHRGLTLDSYLDFNAGVCSRINRLIAGPPALRSAQLLALADAGILSFPYGPGPALWAAGRERGRVQVSSTGLCAAHGEEVALVIRGYLEEPRIERSASALLRGLYEHGRIGPLRYGSTAVGSVDLTPDAHPVASDGTPQERLWLFGVLTEGVRHFNHYIPSPRSRARAVTDIGRCVAEILEGAGSPRARRLRGGHADQPSSA